MKRHSTKYPGIFYREADRIGRPGKEKVFYIVFKRNGKVFEEKVGRQYADDMTPAKRPAYVQRGSRTGDHRGKKSEKSARPSSGPNALWDAYC